MNRIMVVDDDEDIAQLIQEALVFAGYHVEVANSGEECLEKVADFSPELILLDIMMPGLDGWQVLGELKKRGHCQTARVIMLTAKHLSEQDTRRRVFDQVLHYIHKPISMRRLIQEIESIFQEEVQVAEEKKRVSASLGDNFAGSYGELLEESFRRKRILGNLFLTDASQKLLEAPEDVGRLLRSLDIIQEELGEVEGHLSPLSSFFVFGLEKELERLRAFLQALEENKQN